MEDILSFLLVLLIFAAVSSSARKKAKRQKDLKQPGRTAPKASGPAPQPAPEPASPVPVESHSHPEPRESVYQGSLGVSYMEGVDPCHDDPLSMPSGSLQADVPEGTDPCHDGLTPVSPAAEAAPETGGLDLQFSGNDIVKGFVWGEILNRKRA